MDKKKEKSIYVSSDLHFQIKMHCLKHNLGPMKDWISGILAANVVKPSAKERLERQASEVSKEDKELIDKEMEIIKSGNQEIIKSGNQEIGNMIKVL